MIGEVPIMKDIDFCNIIFVLKGGFYFSTLTIQVTSPALQFIIKEDDLDYPSVLIAVFMILFISFSRSLK